MRAVVSSVCVLVACGRSGSGSEAGSGKAVPLPPPAAPAAAAPSSRPAEAGCTVPVEDWRFPAVERVVSFGDVHGDLEATRRALRVGGVIDADDRWTGGKTWVVQVGDQLDRGDQEQAILDLFERLERDAAAAGGRFLWLLGNHELMNAAGDLRYVTPGGFKDFEDVPGLPLDRFAEVPAPARARVAAFAPGGPYAKVLAGQHVVARVGDTVFVHGGLVPGVAAGLDASDRAARCWLAGQGPLPALLEDSTGPVWDRSVAGDDVDCARVEAALREVDAARMVVGHTPQPRGVTSACDGKVWRVDVGLARYYGGPTEVLELTAAGPRVLR